MADRVPSLEDRHQRDTLKKLRTTEVCQLRAPFLSRRGHRQASHRTLPEAEQDAYSAAPGKPSTIRSPLRNVGLHLGRSVVQSHRVQVKYLHKRVRTKRRIQQSQPSPFTGPTPTLSCRRSPPATCAQKGQEHSSAPCQPSILPFPRSCGTPEQPLARACPYRSDPACPPALGRAQCPSA